MALAILVISVSKAKWASAVTNLSDFKPLERTQEALLSTHWHEFIY